MTDPYQGDDKVVIHRRNRFIELGFESDHAIAFARDYGVDVGKISKFIKDGVPHQVLWDHYGAA